VQQCRVGGMTGAMTYWQETRDSGLFVKSAELDGIASVPLHMDRQYQERSRHRYLGCLPRCAASERVDILSASSQRIEVRSRVGHLFPSIRRKRVS
jgi:hypothetical protein